MCFHLLAENSLIAVKYAIEEIRIKKNGESDIVVDMWVENCGQRDIEKYYLIYPLSPQKLSGFSYKIEDATRTFFDGGSFLNAKYSSFLLNCVSDKDKTHVYNVTFPSHSAVHARNSPIEFKVDNEDKFYGQRGKKTIRVTKWGGENPGVEDILNDIGISIAEFIPLSPTKPGEIKFFRFKIGPYQSSLNRHGFFNLRLGILRAFGKACTFFEIVSPYDVMHRFITKLLLVESGPITTNLKSVVGEIKIIFGKIENSPTVYCNWRINIFPRHNHYLHNIQMFGNIKPMGPLPTNDEIFIKSLQRSITNVPNRIWTSIKYKINPHLFRSYQFISKNEECYFRKWIENGIKIEEICKYDEECGFNVYFSVKSIPTLIQTLLTVLVVVVPISIHVIEIPEWVAMAERYLVSIKLYIEPHLIKIAIPPLLAIIGYLVKNLKSSYSRGEFLLKFIVMYDRLKDMAAGFGFIAPR